MTEYKLSILGVSCEVDQCEVCLFSDAHICEFDNKDICVYDEFDRIYCICDDISETVLNKRYESFRGAFFAQAEGLRVVMSLSKALRNNI